MRQADLGIENARPSDGDAMSMALAMRVEGSLHGRGDESESPPSKDATCDCRRRQHSPRRAVHHGCGTSPYAYFLMALLRTRRANEMVCDLGRLLRQVKNRRISEMSTIERPKRRAGAHAPLSSCFRWMNSLTYSRECGARWICARRPGAGRKFLVVSCMVEPPPKPSELRCA